MELSPFVEVEVFFPVGIIPQGFLQYITSTVTMFPSMHTLSNQSFEVYFLIFPVDFPEPDLFICLCIFSMTKTLPESNHLSV